MFLSPDILECVPYWEKEKREGRFASVRTGNRRRTRGRYTTGTSQEAKALCYERSAGLPHFSGLWGLKVVMNNTQTSINAMCVGPCAPFESGDSQRVGRHRQNKVMSHGKKHTPTKTFFFLVSHRHICLFNCSETEKHDSASSPKIIRKIWQYWFYTSINDWLTAQFFPYKLINSDSLLHS